VASGQSARDEADEVFNLSFSQKFDSFVSRAAVAIPSGSKYLLPQEVWSEDTATQHHELRSLLDVQSEIYDYETIAAMPIDEIPFAGDTDVHAINKWSRHESNPYNRGNVLNPQSFAAGIMRKVQH
jgi:hypothetical protein